MATFAEYILNEPDLIKKIDIISYLKKRQNIFFNSSVILKTEIARQFIDLMKLDVDRSLVLTACLMYNCLRVDSLTNNIQKSPREYKEYYNHLGFDNRFAKICVGHSRKALGPNVKREKESDILELADQFGGLIMHRSDRIAYTVPEALEILNNHNLKDSDNVYLSKFQEFVDIMEDLDESGLLTRFQLGMNSVQRDDIPDAVRELYITIERNAKAFKKREAELSYGGNLLDELRKARAKLKYFEEAPLLPGFNMEDLD